MNHVELSGTIQSGPDFHTVEKTGAEVGKFTLCCGTANRVIYVVATDSAVSELHQFQTGDSVAIEGRIVWLAETLLLLAEAIRKWTPGVYRKDPQQDKFPRQVKGMRGVPLP
jgi:hypothetical protein